MKKLLIGLSLISLTACGVAEANQEEKEERFTDYDNHFMMTTDKETGCKYLIYDWDRGAGITPLLKQDGTPDCE